MLEFFVITNKNNDYHCGWEGGLFYDAVKWHSDINKAKQWKSIEGAYSNYILMYNVQQRQKMVDTSPYQILKYSNNCLDVLPVEEYPHYGCKYPEVKVMTDNHTILSVVSKVESAFKHNSLPMYDFDNFCNIAENTKSIKTVVAEARKLVAFAFTP